MALLTDPQLSTGWEWNKNETDACPISVYHGDNVVFETASVSLEPIPKFLWSNICIFDEEEGEGG